MANMTPYALSSLLTMLDKWTLILLHVHSKLTLGTAGIGPAQTGHRGIHDLIVLNKFLKFLISNGCFFYIYFHFNHQVKQRFKDIY